MEDRTQIALLLGELTGEVKQGFKGIEKRFDEMEKTIDDQGKTIAELKTESNQRIGKASIIGAASGVAFSILGAFISGGWFHR